MSGIQKITTVVDTIGNTPMVSLTDVEGIGATEHSAEFVGKLEYMNPGGSIKDRVAKHIVQQLDKQGVAKDALLVVAGPGNLAVSLSMLKRRLVCLIPERTSGDRIRLLKASGVTDIVRTLDGALPGSPEHPAEIGRRIVDQYPGSVYVDEEQGLWDLEECYKELAAEILDQCDGMIDALVLGVDTGNAATHLSKALKASVSGVQVVGVEPSNSAIGEQNIVNPLARRWLCEDIGRAYAPRALEPGSIDMWIQVSDPVAYSMARRLIKAGIHSGTSAGASVAAARMFAASAGLCRGNRVVVIIGDTSRNYGDTLLSDEWMLAHDLLDVHMLGDLQRKQLGQYRGASIEDLQLPAAVTVNSDDPVGAAVALMSENEFSQVPVTGAQRRLVGYLTLSAAQALIDSGAALPSSPVKQFMLKFAGSGGGSISRSKYWLITPETPLSDLAKFFETHSVAFITDSSRKFCLGIATKQDLLTFLARRNALCF
ncbi:hypothetical protein H4R99_000339 [Coemansia sp. RSA 1722]|nr:hypothetical protein IWW45_004869 [Coemansia sp. RSA 485]KAJ2606507.1 hypothetical protein H4R99_000339 [Coemansia sp. RSA 1722]